MNELQKHLFLCNTLDFKIERVIGDTKYDIQSGADGNIFVWDPSYIDEALLSKSEIDEPSSSKEKNPKQKKTKKKVSESTKFDVMSLHSTLFRKELEIKKARVSPQDNVVIPALTIILKKNEKFYSITYDLFREESSKDKDSLVFVSGTEGRKITNIVDASTYSLSQLFERSLERKAYLMDDELTKIFEQICIYQSEKIVSAKKLLSDPRDVLQMENLLQYFDEKSTPKDPYHKKHGGYGPIADSEQFLLYFLGEELSNPQGISTSKKQKLKKGLFTNIKENHIDQQYEYIKDTYSVHSYKDLKKAQETFEKGVFLSQKIDFVPCVCILHLFSTRELCKFCAATLIKELNCDHNFVSQIKESMKLDIKNEPFFVIFASSGMKIEDQFKGVSIRPSGTISTYTGEPNNGLLNLNYIIDNNMLPILLDSRYIDEKDKNLPQKKTNQDFSESE